MLLDISYVFIFMDTTEIKRSLKAALRPHLKILRVMKAKMSDREFAELVVDFEQKLLSNPRAYLAGVEDSLDVKLTIESIIDEVVEN